MNKLSFSHPKESPYEILVQLAQWFQRRRCLKMDARVIGMLLAHLGAFGLEHITNIVMRQPTIGIKDHFALVTTWFGE